MKIAIVTDHIPSKWAHSINTMKIANGFYKLGYEVEVLVVRRFIEEKNRFKTKDIHKLYDIEQDIKLKFFRDYSPYYFKEVRYLGPFLIKTTNILTKLYPKLRVFLDPEKRISEYCKRNKFNFVFCRRTHNTVYYNIFNKIPSVLDTHTYRDPKLKLILKLIKSKYFRGIMTINELIKEKLINKGFSKNKIVSMENAIELDKYDGIKLDKKTIRKKLKLPIEKDIILYSGGLYSHKGINIILEAAKLLEEKEYSFILIGGDKKDIKKWKEYMDKNKVDSDIHFLGWKNRRLIPYFLKAADILLAIYSAKDPTIEFISPIKIIEYMASKTPFIATKMKRTLEICNNNECVFTNIDDPKDLSEKICLLLNDENLRNKLINKAYLKALKFTLDKRCEKILDLSKNN